MGPTSDARGRAAAAHRSRAGRVPSPVGGGGGSHDDDSTRIASVALDGAERADFDHATARGGITGLHAVTRARRSIRSDSRPAGGDIASVREEAAVRPRRHPESGFECLAEMTLISVTGVRGDGRYGAAHGTKRGRRTFDPD